MITPKKALGQHWLEDREALEAVAAAAEITPADTVLEVGPGLGYLTEILLEQAKQVIAVEADPELVKTLTENLFAPNLRIVEGDILRFNLKELPSGYKVAANIPYYLTSSLLRVLLESVNPPEIASLLVQKEVAERVTAGPGAMSVLAVSVQYYTEAQICRVVPKELFTPPPKVDSAILQLKKRPEPYFEADPSQLFRLVKAGFGERRKQLKNALAGGLRLSVEETDSLLADAGIAPTARAQELSLDQWRQLYQTYVSRYTV